MRPSVTTHTCAHAHIHVQCRHTACTCAGILCRAGEGVPWPAQCPSRQPFLPPSSLCCPTRAPLRRDGASVGLELHPARSLMGDSRRGAAPGAFPALSGRARARRIPSTHRLCGTLSGGVFSPGKCPSPGYCPASRPVSSGAPERLSEPHSTSAPRAGPETGPSAPPLPERVARAPPCVRTLLPTDTLPPHLAPLRAWPSGGDSRSRPQRRRSRMPRRGGGWAVQLRRRVHLLPEGGGQLGP